jgi:hypothetical protein
MAPTPIPADSATNSVRSDAGRFDTSSILPPAPIGDDGEPLEVLHDREYRVQAYRKSDDVILLRGAVRDQKPPGLYIDIDPDPLTIHHMQIDLEIGFPSMEIVAARVGIEVHPNRECPTIEAHYGELVGLSIARGFTHKVRELFGGPRGCTHTTALLQAMAPVAIQCSWSMRASMARRAGVDGGAAEPTPEQRRMMWQMNLNTCHVWAEDGEQVQRLTAGGEFEPPLFAQERMVQLGLKPEDWRRRMQS